MSYAASIDALDARTLRYRISRDDAPLHAGDAIAALESDAAFRAFLTAQLAEAPCVAFFWETPPLTETTLDHPFEFVLTDSPALAARRPDPGPFAEQFREDAPIAVFASLGGDATLVAPCPRVEGVAHAHLAAFLRSAPADQIDALWRATGSAMRQSLGAAPRWLSTSGLGVSWLHVRIDSRPKYYVYAPYRRSPA